MFQDFRSVQHEQQSQDLTNPQKPPFEIFSLLCTHSFELSKLVVARRGAGEDPEHVFRSQMGIYSRVTDSHPATSGSQACFNCCMMEPDSLFDFISTSNLLHISSNIFQATPQPNSTFECPQVQARAEYKGLLLSARSAGLDCTKIIERSTEGNQVGIDPQQHPLPLLWLC